MKHLTQISFALIIIFIFSCGGKNTETESKSKDTLQKETETTKEEPKEEPRSLSEAEMTFAKKWEVTEFYVPGSINEYKDKDYFIDLQKGGSFACKFVMDEEGKEIKGEGKWKLTSPKATKWQIEGATEPLELAPTQEVLELTFGNDKPQKYVIEILEGKMHLFIPGNYYEIGGVSK
jgi:hypothetical protein